MTDMATWRSRVFALAVALTLNLIIFWLILTTEGRTLWSNEVKQPRDAIITFTPWRDMDRVPIPKARRALRLGPNSILPNHRAPVVASMPTAPEPLPTPRPTLAPVTAASPTSEAALAARLALQGLAACSASRRPVGPADQQAACRREYAKGPAGLTATAFIDPLKRAGFDAVAGAQEAKRAMMLGPISDGYVACTGYRSNAMFGCPPPPRPKMPPANLWEASAPSTDARGEP